VYRQINLNKTEFKLIAKHIHKGSKERAIHRYYLHARPSQSLHAIQLIEAVPSEHQRLAHSTKDAVYPINGIAQPYRHSWYEI
jgi:hypothetical protein